MSNMSNTNSSGETVAAPGYGFGTTLSLSFEQAIARVTEALKSEGFGVLTTIDVRTTLQQKLHVDVAPYTILGACNPQLAHRALGIEPSVGLLLPCNVVLRADASSGGAAPEPARTRVEIADPVAMLGVVRNEAMRAVAQEARSRLQRVLDALGGNQQG